MSIDDKRRYATAGFVMLLLLSVFWPSPVVSSNRLWLDRSLSVDELSFLGREAPSWDMVFWCLAGLFALAVVQSGDVGASREVVARFTGRSTWRAARPTWPRWYWILSGAVTVALTWLLIDGPAIAMAERLQTDGTEAAVRILNRFGGGWNPPLIVFFFLLAGLSYGLPRWTGYGVAMALSGSSAGLVAHALKLTVGRVRPELWLGPFQYARGAANSFPSGHTVGAFALAGVLIFSSTSTPLRVTAFVLATAVALSRVFAFRHWPSDVVASALLGLLAAWIANQIVTRVTNREPART